MRIAAAFALCTVLLAACGKSGDSSSSSGSSTSTGSGSSAAKADGNMPGLDASTDLSKNLQELMDRTYSAAANDPAELSKLAKSFWIPDPEGWAKKTFGDEKGAAVADGMKKMSGDFEGQVKSLFQKVVGEKQTVIEVVRVTSADDKNGTGLQREAIGAMKEKCALYLVRFKTPGESAGQTVWNWVYVDGGFRLVGKLK